MTGGQSTLPLPEIYDINNDTYSLEVIGLKDYMTFNEKDLSITVDSAGLESNEITTIEIILKDSQGSKNSYKVKVNVKVVSEFAIDIPFIVVEEESEEVHPEDWQKEEVVYPKNFTAKIASIDSLGKMILEFNSSVSMANVSDINSTALEMYIVPAQNRHLQSSNFSLSQLNFTF